MIYSLVLSIDKESSSQITNLISHTPIIYIRFIIAKREVVLQPVCVKRHFLTKIVAFLSFHAECIDLSSCLGSMDVVKSYCLTINKNVGGKDSEREQTEKNCSERNYIIFGYFFGGGCKYNIMFYCVSAQST